MTVWDGWTSYKDHNCHSKDKRKSYNKSISKSGIPNADTICTTEMVLLKTKKQCGLICIKQDHTSLSVTKCCQRSDAGFVDLSFRFLETL